MSRSATAPASITERIATSRPIFAAIIFMAVFVVVASAVRFQEPQLLGVEKSLTDFDAFYIAGTMAANGQAADAYHADALMKVQRGMTGSQDFLPWTYPPPFTLLMQAWAALPIGFAFGLFALASCLFYLAILSRIAGPQLPGVLLAITPVIYINLRTGQNGFLIAGLVGAFLLAWRDRRTLAGLPLGLMILKPHLAAGVGLMALLGRRWSTLALAALVAAVALAASTVAYGWDIWQHFANAVQEAKQFLQQGYYPLFRMNSAYAALYSFGVPAPVAIVVHALGALAALGVIVWACLAGLPFRFQAALICAMSLFVSPYSYDYDMTILGVALAFVLPDLIERCSRKQMAGLFTLSWATCGYGMALQLYQDLQNTGQTPSRIDPLALIFPALVALCLAVARLLTKAPVDAPNAVPQDGRFNNLAAPVAADRQG